VYVFGSFARGALVVGDVDVDIEYDAPDLTTLWNASSLTALMVEDVRDFLARRSASWRPRTDDGTRPIRAR
jgi:hypothetical protein